jgi:AraC-like DNA-binding protein
MPIPLSHPALELRTYGGEVRRHAHPHHQAVLPVEGRLAMRVGGSSGAVAAGAGVFVAAGTVHAFSAAGANRFVVIDVPAHGTLADDLIDAAAVAPFFAVDAPLQGLLAYLSDAARLRPLERDEALNAAALLAAAIARRIETGRAAATDGVARAIALAERRLEERLGITDLAAAARMGRSRFHEAFRQRTGRTPAAFLLRSARIARSYAGSGIVEQAVSNAVAAIIVRMVLRITSPDPIPGSGPSACSTKLRSPGVSSID